MFQSPVETITFHKPLLSFLLIIRLYPKVLSLCRGFGFGLIPSHFCFTKLSLETMNTEEQECLTSKGRAGGKLKKRERERQENNWKMAQKGLFKQKKKYTCPLVSGVWGGLVPGLKSFI